MDNLSIGTTQSNSSLPFDLPPIIIPKPRQPVEEPIYGSPKNPSKKRKAVCFAEELTTVIEIPSRRKLLDLANGVSPMIISDPVDAELQSSASAANTESQSQTNANNFSMISEEELLFFIQCMRDSNRRIFEQQNTISCSHNNINFSMGIDDD